MFFQSRIICVLLTIFELADIFFSPFFSMQKRLLTSLNLTERILCDSEKKYI